MQNELGKHAINLMPCRYWFSAVKNGKAGMPPAYRQMREIAYISHLWQACTCSKRTSMSNLGMDL